MKKVLIVEDDQSLRVVIRMVLEQAGYAVVEASHGAAALELMESEMPDLVLADVRMPHMSGVELIARLRSSSRTASVPIVLLSGLVLDPEVARLADAVVAKPFEPADLVAAISGSLDARGGDPPPQ
ncbi:MAG TPA: response regulator [Candidatus Dormibacteraeota bacterium]|nr:response regulator [Candidatus Dormibacteraeota bacterium]